MGKRCIHQLRKLLSGFYLVVENLVRHVDNLEESLLFVHFLDLQVHILEVWSVIPFVDIKLKDLVVKEFLCFINYILQCEFTLSLSNFLVEILNFCFVHSINFEEFELANVLITLGNGKSLDHGRKDLILEVYLIFFEKDQAFFLVVEDLLVELGCPILLYHFGQAAWLVQINVIKRGVHVDIEQDHCPAYKKIYQ